MSDFESNFETTVGCESNEELNGKDASFRGASMISSPRLVQKLRRRGALVPISVYDDTSSI
jgi:hypothetical protein